MIPTSDDHYDNYENEEDSDNEDVDVEQLKKQLAMLERKAKSKKQDASDSEDDEEEKEQEPVVMPLPVEAAAIPSPVKTQKVTPPPTAKPVAPVSAPQKLEVPTGAGVGFDSAAPKEKAKASAETDPADEMEELASMLYDQLRGRDKTLSVDKFRAWDELQEAYEK